MWEQVELTVAEMVRVPAGALRLGLERFYIGVRCGVRAEQQDGTP